MLEKAGLGALREKYILENHVLTLEEFLAPQDHRDWSEPAFGLSIIDVFRHLHETEQRFELRDKRPSVLIKPERSSGLVEAVFGTYPRQKDVDYIATGYKDVFVPRELEANPESWLDVFKHGAQTPLRVTRHEIDVQRYWYHDLVVYVFDPTKPTDLIDLWNLRLEPDPVLPVPVDWFGGLVDFIRDVVEAEHRPVKGNPSGIMHRATVEFGRSIANDRVEDLIDPLKDDLPNGALSVKHWRNPIWEQHTDDLVHREKRLVVTAEEQRANLSIGDTQELNTSFEALSPIFAARFGGHSNRWVNAITLSRISPENIATVLPFNMYDRRWPSLGFGGDRVIVGSEGWIFGQRWENWSEAIIFLTKEEAIIGSLERLGVTASLSDPGHIAKSLTRNEFIDFKLLRFSV